MFFKTKFKTWQLFRTNLNQCLNKSLSINTSTNNIKFDKNKFLSRINNNELKRLLDEIKPFNKYEQELAIKRDQANKSILFYFDNWNASHIDYFLDDIICTGSNIKKLFFYGNLHQNYSNRQILIEFETRQCVFNIINNFSEKFPNYKNEPISFSRLLFYDINKIASPKFKSNPSTFNRIKKEMKIIQDIWTTNRFIDQLAVLKNKPCNDQIENLFNLFKIDEMNSRIRFFIASLIEQSLRGMFRKCMCVPFGSSINKFGLKSADLDMLFLVDQTCVEAFNQLNLYKTDDLSFNVNNESFFGNFRHMNRRINQNLEILDIIKYVIDTLPNFKINIAIKRARVPIIKFDFDFSKQVKINCDITTTLIDESFFMSKLFWTYSHLDSRVAPFVFLVRIWAKICGITNDKRPTQHPTNYIVTTLALNYLLRMKNPIIVPIDKIDFNNLSVDGMRLNLTQSNNKDLNDLFIGFLNYYSNFDFKLNAITLNKNLEINKSTCLHIINPFDPTKNASDNVGNKQLNKFIACCNDSFKIIQGIKDKRNNNFDLVEFLDNVSGIYSKGQDNFDQFDF